MLSTLALTTGIVLLIKGADWLVVGAGELSSRLGISSLAIGLTVVSLGTSLPEMIVTMLAALRNAPGLAVENVVGSNIANILLVLGVAAAIRPLQIGRSTLVSVLPFSLAAAMLVGFVANAHVLSASSSAPMLSHFDGVLLLLFFVLFMFYTTHMNGTVSGAESSSHLRNEGRPILRVVIGAGALCLGGAWAVDGAVGLARLWGVDDALIGLTIVAFGTSIPELVASSVAAYRGQVDIAVGNVLGSNIFNLLWVLGATSSVIELPFNVLTNRDLTIVILATTAVLVSAVVTRQSRLGRWHGVVFASIYLGYLVYVTLRV